MNDEEVNNEEHTDHSSLTQSESSLSANDESRAAHDAITPASEEEEDETPAAAHDDDDDEHNIAYPSNASGKKKASDFNEHVIESSWEECKDLSRRKASDHDDAAAPFTAPSTSMSMDKQPFLNAAPSTSTNRFELSRDTHPMVSAITTATTPGARRVYPSSHYDNENNAIHREAAEPSEEFEYDETLVHAGVPATDQTIPEQPVLVGMVVDTSATSEQFPALDATPVQGMYIQRKRCLWLSTVLMVLLLCVVIGLSVGLTMTRHASSSEAAPPASSSFQLPPTISRLVLTLPSTTIEILRSELPVDSRANSNWYKLTNVWANDTFTPVTPQGKAWQWLIRDPSRQFSRSLEDVTLRFVLATFYYSTNGPQWINSTNWLGTKHVCHWYTDDFRFYDAARFDSAAASCLVNGYTQLSLQSNNLNGTVPEEFCMLSSLEFLKLSGNALRGTLSAAMWESWANLRSILLYDNQFSGTFPSTVGRLTEVGWFWVQSNRFSGSLPSEMGNMQSLSQVDLDDNMLSSTLPSQLGRLFNVQEFSAYNNRLTGPVPTELFNPQALSVLDLASNRLSGTLASEIGQLTKLNYLSLNDNVLKGSMPTQLGELTTLFGMDFSNNTRLTGSIPDELSELVRLASLQMFGTNISGRIPSSVCEASNGNIAIDCNLVQCDCNCTCI